MKIYALTVERVYDGDDVVAMPTAFFATRELAQQELRTDAERKARVAELQKARAAEAAAVPRTQPPNCLDMVMAVNAIYLHYQQLDAAVGWQQYSDAIVEFELTEEPVVIGEFVDERTLDLCVCGHTRRGHARGTKSNDYDTSCGITGCLCKAYFRAPAAEPAAEPAASAAAETAETASAAAFRDRRAAEFEARRSAADSVVASLGAAFQSAGAAFEPAPCLVCAARAAEERVEKERMSALEERRRRLQTLMDAFDSRPPPEAFLAFLICFRGAIHEIAAAENTSIEVALRYVAFEFSASVPSVKGWFDGTNAPAPQMLPPIYEYLRKRLALIYLNLLKTGEGA